VSLVLDMLRSLGGIVVDPPRVQWVKPPEETYGVLALSAALAVRRTVALGVESLPLPGERTAESVYPYDVAVVLLERLESCSEKAEGIIAETILVDVWDFVAGAHERLSRIRAAKRPKAVG